MGNKKLLERRNDSLTKAEQTLIERILQLSFELKESYWFKEALIEWYDYSNKKCHKFIRKMD
ncbi:transposase [Cellulosilyticum ruminicola]|uniref:transposase n=1 Tax=Cellulosilyticum ruminicola TaxID=425254 RepID=UPI00155DC279